jgi:hypothetical protein
MILHVGLMTTRWTIICTLFSLGLAVGYEPSPEEFQELNVKLDRWVAASEQLSSPPTESELSNLSLGVWKLSHSSNYPIERRKEVFAAVQRKLLSLPDHAAFLEKRIRQVAALQREGKDTGPKNYDVLDFETLGLLPSPQSVRALGSFLEEDEGKISDEELRATPRDVIPTAARNLLAARALATLGIVSPPLHNTPRTMGYAEVEPWLLWFKQVEAGKRTFRFEGDPNEYSLAGPVVKAAEPVVIRPEPKGPDTTSQEAIGKPSKLPVAALVGAIALLLAAIWLALKKRSSAAAG